MENSIKTISATGQCKDAWGDSFTFWFNYEFEQKIDFPMKWYGQILGRFGNSCNVFIIQNNHGSYLDYFEFDFQTDDLKIESRYKNKEVQKEIIKSINQNLEKAHSYIQR